MTPVHFHVQSVITRGLDPAPAAGVIGARLTLFDETSLVETLAAAEAAQRSNPEQRPVVFCSLPAAAHIERACPELARGVVLPRQFLRHSVYSALLPREILLNPDGIYLPWGRIPAFRETLESLFPGGVFIRPDSPMKPFTGFAVTHDRLGEEWHLMGQVARIAPEELVYLCPARRLPPREYRTWLVDARPVAAAAYSWEETSPHSAGVPGEILRAARRVGEILEMREQVYTADFVITGDGPRLVELNAMSTSGWYEGLDLRALFSALDGIFV